MSGTTEVTIVVQTTPDGQWSDIVKRALVSLARWFIEADEDAEKLARHPAVDIQVVSRQWEQLGLWGPPVPYKDTP